MNQNYTIKAIYLLFNEREEKKNIQQPHTYMTVAESKKKSLNQLNT